MPPARELEGEVQVESLYVMEMKKRVEEARKLQRDMEAYEGWIDARAKTGQVNFRISKMDLTRFKALAKAQGRRYQTYLVELIQRELREASPDTPFQAPPRRKVRKPD
jgi:predicted DNA binding CopG/RHH family protein